MKHIAIDIEAIGLKPYGGTIWMLSVTEGKKISLYENCNGLKSIPKELQKKLANPSICKVIHNATYDGTYIGLNLGCAIRNIWDTYLCEIVIQGMRVNGTMALYEDLRANHSAALDYVLQRYGYPKPDKDIRRNFIGRELGKKFTQEEKEYAKNDTKHLLAIQQKQLKILEGENLLQVAELENKLVERIIDMRIRGIGFDSNVWQQIAEENTREFKKRMSKLPKCVNNWNSPKQVKEYFIQQGIAIDSYSNLEAISRQNKDKTLSDFIYARELHKAVTSYGINWFEEKHIDADDRIRCEINQIINTGRNSISEPPLQQLPKNGKHRGAFVPKKGHVFVIGDFSQQELGIMAAMSGEKNWIGALLRGEDIHAITAANINPAAWQKATQKGCTFPKKCSCKGHLELRDPAKINNFMLAYGGGAQTFSDNTGISLLEAKEYVRAHKRTIPTLTRCLEQNAQHALSTGVSYSADPYRRRRTLVGQENWQIANQGKNNPIQSAGANMLKHAMVNLPASIPIVLVIHDEIICEVPKNLAAKTAKILKQTMEQAANYITGIDGLIKVEPRIAFNLLKEKN